MCLLGVLIFGYESAGVQLLLLCWPIEQLFQTSTLLYISDHPELEMGRLLLLVFVQDLDSTWSKCTISVLLLLSFSRVVGILAGSGQDVVNICGPEPLPLSTIVHLYRIWLTSNIYISRLGPSFRGGDLPPCRLRELKVLNRDRP